VGEEYLTPLNMFYEDRWKDAWIVFAFFGEHNFAGFSQNQSDGTYPKV
jgi:hypothetical protein